MKFDFTKEPGRQLESKYTVKDEVPLVTIITPYYNAGQYFEQTYNSVMNQTFPYFEWIIIDDGSTCTEDKIILDRLEKTDARIKVFHEENRGAAGARKCGIKKSLSEVIIFIDADDLIEKQYVEYVYWALERNPGAMWAYTDSLGFYEKEYLWQEEFSSDEMKKRNILTYIAAIRKKVFQDDSIYDEYSGNMWEDWQFWLRLLVKGYYPVHIKQVMFWYRRLSNGALAKIEQDKKLKSKLEEKIRELAKDVPKGIKAITYDGKRNQEFASIERWQWNREFPYKEERTKILMLLPHMERGGADKFNLDIVQNINRQKYEIGIITTVPAQCEWRQKFNEYVDDIFELPNFLGMEDWCGFIYYYITSRKVDIVFNLSSYFGYYALPWLRREFPKIGIIDCVHAEGKYWRSGGYPRISGTVDEVIEKTLVSNKYTRDIIVNKYQKPESKTKVIYTGADEKYFNPDLFDRTEIRKKLKIEDDRPIVLYLCRIAPEKRPFLMLEIAKEVKKRIHNICFLVVGEGPQLVELREKVKKENLQDTIYILGAQKDIRPYYVASDLSLICSLKEGLAITTFEAMLMKKPVVSANVGGQCELVNSDTGRLVECRQDEEKDFDNRQFEQQEVDDYVQAIYQLMKDKEQLMIMGEKCREQILNGYTITDLINTLEKEFDEIKSESNYQHREEISKALRLLGKLPEEIITIYNEYESIQVEFRGAYRFMQYCKDIITFKRSIISVWKEVIKQKSNPKVYRMLKKLGVK